MRDGKAQGRLARDLPGGVSPAAFTLEEVRAAKQTYGFLTEVIPGPEGIGYFSRGFRYLLFFGIACIAEDKCPPLTRCWKDLATLFMGDSAFDDDLLVQSWILMDFPFGPARHTALDYFDELLTGTDAGPQLQRFIDAARRSRLGLHQDVIRTKKLAKSASCSPATRSRRSRPSTSTARGRSCSPAPWPTATRSSSSETRRASPRRRRSRSKTWSSTSCSTSTKGTATTAQYEAFMKLAGPYWMSCVTKNEDVPVLAPAHYRTYLERCP